MTYIKILKAIVLVISLLVIILYPIIVNHQDPFTFYFDKFRNLFIAIKSLIQMKGG